MPHLKSRRSGQDLRNHPAVKAAEAVLNSPEFIEQCRVHVREKPSTSYLQRKMQIGCNRASAIMEQFEAEGMVSKPNHVGLRTVLR